MRKDSYASAFYELISSMRFAITLLVVIALASMIGTVMKQNEPYTGYLVEFGPFWFEAFKGLGLYSVYSAGWFVGILGFLVTSTSLCIYRHAPQFVREMRSFREHATLVSLSQFAHRTVLPNALPRSEQAQRLGKLLQAEGYRLRAREAEERTSTFTLLAAKKGSAQKLGYFLAHGAIVLICIGGLVDGNLFLRFAQWFDGTVPETRDLAAREVPAQSRLPASNPTFRGNVTVPEGGRTDVLFLNYRDGYFVQELPFTVELKKFYVEHYPTGQPKLFASDIVVTRKSNGKRIVGTAKVNHPIIVDGIAIYQASFGDGGSPLTLARWDLSHPAATPQPLKGTSMATQPIDIDGHRYALEFGEFRFFNIESLGQTDKAKPAEGTFGALRGKMENAMQVVGPHTTQNLGPSIQFKLRDEAGQAREYFNYMNPVTLDGSPYFVSGMRSKVSDPFQYYRFPVDRDGKLDTYMALRARLLDPAARPAIAAAVADRALTDKALGETFRTKFIDSAERVLAGFADGGFERLDKQIAEQVPKDKQSEVGQIYLKILQTAAAVALEQVKPGANANRDFRFVLDSLVSIAASHDYGTPMLLQLTGFERVQASGFQIARAPGKTLVYLGCLLLVLGVFSMLYLRERRAWIVCKDGETWLAMSGNRKSLQFEQEFADLSARVRSAIGESAKDA